jgi:hypothetical protein
MTTLICSRAEINASESADEVFTSISFLTPVLILRRRISLHNSGAGFQCTLFFTAAAAVNKTGIPTRRSGPS